MITLRGVAETVIAGFQISDFRFKIKRQRNILKSRWLKIQDQPAAKHPQESPAKVQNQAALKHDRKIRIQDQTAANSHLRSDSRLAIQFLPRRRRDSSRLPRVQ
jgi:hypothetical protein